MCGTVGLFVGCSAVVDCPLRAVAPPWDAEPDDGEWTPPPSPPPDYHSAFDGWYERATVRTAPRRTVAAGDLDRMPFDSALVPVASHPLVQALPPDRRRDLLLRHLYRYLRFTATLESAVVNPSLLAIANGADGLTLPDQMRFDALKMYCDEAYHTLFSVDLLRQVQDLTGAPADPEAQPYFLRRLRTLRQGLDRQGSALVDLLFVSISETLISATLVASRQGDGVIPAVSESIRDHALDEGRHHAFFADYIAHALGGMTPRQRRLTAGFVPGLIKIFLEPDLDGVRRDLRRQGLTPSEVATVTTEVFAPERIQPQWRRMASATLRYFAIKDAFGPQALDELLAMGLDHSRPSAREQLKVPGWS